MVGPGDSGDLVRELQRLVGANDDGIFGPDTQRKFNAWAAAQGTALATVRANSLTVYDSANPTPDSRPVDHEFDHFGNYGLRTFNGEQQFHPGIDIPNGAGQPVLAAYDGVVAKIGPQWGGWVGIKSYYANEDGDLAQFGSRYMHNSVVVAEGDVVHAGDVIGYTVSGSAVPEFPGFPQQQMIPHLHFEVHENGTVDMGGDSDPTKGMNQWKK